jgi:flagellar basal-body rod modification protein FlgD
MSSITNYAGMAQSALMAMSPTTSTGAASSLLNMGQMPAGGSATVSGGSPLAASGTVPSSTTTSSSDNGLSSSDFLTLLVSELKNQDPTQPTDPNAYITQLVGVNSLQQLISINQDLTPSTTGSATTGSTATTAVGQ